MDMQLHVGHALARDGRRGHERDVLLEVLVLVVELRVEALLGEREQHVRVPLPLLVAVLCRAPYRPFGSVETVHVSVTGMATFSEAFAMLTYYDDSPMLPGAGPTQVSTIHPTYGPIRGTNLIVATGSNFAPTGWSADAVGVAASLACGFRPDGWSLYGHLVDALYVSTSRVLCNMSADVFSAVGDATLGVTLMREQVKLP